MDDPDHLAKRSIDLFAFRQQRSFNRAKSFTFGESMATSTLLSIAPVGSRPKLNRTNSLAPSGFSFPPLKNTVSAPSDRGNDERDPMGEAEVMIAEEDHEAAGDSSFRTGTTGSSPGQVGDSPCPANNVGRFSLKLGKEAMMGGRKLQRAQTSAVLMFGSR